MRTIWKFSLRVTDEQFVQMPESAEILAVQAQGLNLCLWAVVNTAREKIARKFWVVGTGNPMPPTFGEEYIDYIGSAQCGSFVWHVFDGGEAE